MSVDALIEITSDTFWSGARIADYPVVRTGGNSRTLACPGSLQLELDGACG
ncbi:hypothetical protein ACVWZX_001929 [Deinococcus sp. UYEF24]